MQNHSPISVAATELIVDLFAGGGGASTGIEQALGRPVDIAVNHDPDAVAMHAINHPRTRHYCEDVFNVDPVKVCRGKPVGLLWASPACTHFSKARGAKPVSKQLRSLAWVVVKWAKLVRPRMIFLENVTEFAKWGPVLENGQPCKLREGETFERWKIQLESLGYKIETRELVACDYGAPTIRKRLFLIARCDGQPIVWPEPTHARPDKDGNVPAGMKPWRTAAECIDFSIPIPSIFERKKPLVVATLRRIAKGIQRYVINAASPFLVQYHSAKRDGDDRTASIDMPLPTQTTENRFALAQPFLTEHANASNQRVMNIDEPLRTQCANVKGGHFSIVAPTLIQTGYGERPESWRCTSCNFIYSREDLPTCGCSKCGSDRDPVTIEGQTPRCLDLEKPLGTIVGSQKHALVSSFLAKNYTGVVGSDLEDPMGTVTSIDHHSYVAAHLTKFNTGSVGFAANEPMHTITAGGVQARPGTAITQGIVSASLVHMGHGEGKDGGKRFSHGIRDILKPLNTIAASGSPGAITACHMLKMRGDNVGSDCSEPIHTISAQGTHHALVTALLNDYGDKSKSAAEGFFVRIKDTLYFIADIGLRMLTPRELYNAQGFPRTYVIDRVAGGKKLTATAQVRMVGNSVAPDVACAIVGANYVVQDALLEAA